MRKKRLRFLTAMVLSLVMVFTIVPATAFAASADGSVTVYLNVANYTFDKELLNDNGQPVKPAWSGETIRRMPITVAAGENLADSIDSIPGIEFEDTDYGKMLTSVFGLSGFMGVSASPWGDGSSWAFYMNDKSAASGIGSYVNAVPSSGAIKLNDGDEVGLYYSIDSSTVFDPYLFTASNVIAKATAYNEVSLSWTGCASPVDTWNGNKPFNSSVYDIYRATSVSGAYTKIASVESFASANSYTDKSVMPGKTYYYKIKTVKKNNVSDFSQAASVKPAFKKPVIKVARKYKRSLKVSWKKVAGVKYYQVYRATKKNGKYKRIRTVSAKKLSFINKGLKKGKRYYYKVRGYAKVDGKNAYSSFSAVKYRKR